MQGYFSSFAKLSFDKIRGAHRARCADPLIEGLCRRAILPIRARVDGRSPFLASSGYHRSRRASRCYEAADLIITTFLQTLKTTNVV